MSRSGLHMSDNIDIHQPTLRIKAHIISPRYMTRMGSEPLVSD